MDHGRILCYLKGNSEEDRQFIWSNNPSLEELRNNIHVFDIIDRCTIITIDVFKSNILNMEGLGIRLNDILFSMNPNVTWKDVQNNTDIKWRYSGLSVNQNITWDIIKSNPDKEWHYTGLSYNPNITWDIVNNNSWCWYYTGLSGNPNITWDIIQSNPDKQWSMQKFARDNPNATIDIIKQHANNDWGMMDFVNNPNYVIRQNAAFDKFGNNNPNMTWKTCIELGFDTPSITLIRWNAAQKIQHVFRRWKCKTGVRVGTQLLQDIGLSDDILPIEICDYISVLSVE